MFASIPIAQIDRNREQPRKVFEEGKLLELAASIREHGLLQPIQVRPTGERFVIVLGERRWRAHWLLVEQGHECFRTIAADVQDMSDEEMALRAIVENLARADITPLEEANAFRTLLDRDLTVEQLMTKLGISSRARVVERLSLLNLRPEYLALLKTGQLQTLQAYHISRLEPCHQGVLFDRVRRGDFANVPALRAAATAMLEAEREAELFPSAVPEPTKREREAMSRLEARIDALNRMLASGFEEGEMVAARRVDPGKAETYADKLALIGRHVGLMERALRAGAVQAELRLAS